MTVLVSRMSLTEPFNAVMVLLEMTMVEMIGVELKLNVVCELFAHSRTERHHLNPRMLRTNYPAIQQLFHASHPSIPFFVAALLGLFLILLPPMLRRTNKFPVKGRVNFSPWTMINLGGTVDSYYRRKSRFRRSSGNRIRQERCWYRSCLKEWRKAETRIGKSWGIIPSIRLLTASRLRVFRQNRNSLFIVRIWPTQRKQRRRLLLVNVFLILWCAVQESFWTLRNWQSRRCNSRILRWPVNRSPRLYDENDLLYSVMDSSRIHFTDSTDFRPQSMQWSDLRSLPTRQRDVLYSLHLCSRSAFSPDTQLMRLPKQLYEC